jgi:hypothetical protein
MNLTRSGLLAIAVSAALLCAGLFGARLVAGAFRAQRGGSVRGVQAPRIERPPAPAPAFRRRPPRPVSC